MSGAGGVVPIDQAWVSRGGTGAPNYDEFNSDDEVTALIRQRPGTILPVDMPHCTPADRAAGRSFADALPAAAARLRALRAGGSYGRVTDALVAYRITGDGTEAHGVFVLVATSEISDRPEAPGRVIRNEDVFVEKVRERTAHIQAVHHLVSPVLLLPGADGDVLDDALRAVIGAAAAPFGSDVDEHGCTHEMWLVERDDDRRRLLHLLNGTSLVVADGNHRSLAAQRAGLSHFLAVVTTQRSVRIEPYNRLVHELPMPDDDFVARLRADGFVVRETTSRPGETQAGGPILLHLAGGAAYELEVAGRTGSVVDRLDHAVVEQRIFRDILGWDPGDKRISYVGGEAGLPLLRSALADGGAAAAISVPAVTVDQFVAVNLDRLKMPRKSTWFTPKARSGLVLVELGSADGLA